MPVPSTSLTCVIATTGASTDDVVAKRGRKRSRLRREPADERLRREGVRRDDASRGETADSTHALLLTLGGMTVYSTVNAAIMPARQMLRDVTVDHPSPRIRHVGQQLDRLAGGNDRRVLPDEILAPHAVAGQDEKALAVQVNRMGHRVARRRVVEDSELHHVAATKAPVDVHVLLARRRIAEHPGDLVARRQPVHHRHAVVPLHRRR